MYAIVFMMSTAAAERDPRDLFSRRTSSSSSGNAVGFVSKHINNDRMKAAADGGMQWYYNWDPTPEVTDTAGLQFIPEQWAVDNTGMVAPSGPTQDTVLMYNEPDNPGGLSSSLCFDNGHPSQAAAQRMAQTYCQQISQFKGLGYQKFGTPAWQFDPSNPGQGQDDIKEGCLMPFFEAVAANAECKAATNYFVWHMYTQCTNQSDVQTFCQNRVDGWTSIMQDVETRFKFNFDGMYVTEFAGWGPECVQNFGGDGSAGQAMVAEFCTPIVQSADRMTRFAWFNDFEDYPGQGNSDLFNDDNSLSQIGQAYLRAVSGSANGATGTTTNSASTVGGSTTASPSTTDADSTTVSPASYSTVGGSTTTDADSTTSSADKTTASPDSDSESDSTTEATTTYAPDTTASASTSDDSKPMLV